MRLPALDPFMMALALGVAGGALFGLMLWMRERDRPKRIYWSMRFWLIAATGLALLGLVETGLEKL